MCFNGKCAAAIKVPQKTSLHLRIHQVVNELKYPFNVFFEFESIFLKYFSQPKIYFYLTEGAKAITCETCAQGIVQLAKVFESEKNVFRVIELLIGEAYCTEPSSGLGEPCIEFVEFFVPQAMPLIAQLVRTDTDRLCEEAVQCVPEKK